MNDLVLEGFVKNFEEVRGLYHLDKSDLFEAFVASSIFRKYHQTDINDIEDSVLVGGSGDGGLDVVAIMVNGHPVRTPEDVDFFVDRLQRFDTEFVFVQAKTSTSFSASDIGNFVFGIEQFFSVVSGSEPRIEFNSEVEQLIDLTRRIYEQSIKMQENPKCFLYYITAGTWSGSPDPYGRLADGVDRLRQLKIFSDVRAMPVDAELLKAIYRELERGVVKEVELSRTAVFPRIDGVDDAYIGLLAGDEFMRLVTTDDGRLNTELFYDNVRDFQGNNAVNSEINHTLADEQNRHNFPLLNNGVTIVAREINRRGDIFTIKDFQIVNGCQTTHILFHNGARVDSGIFIPVKLVATHDRRVIVDVIKATNRQTAVLPEALESLTPFHKELEDFYIIKESREEAARRVYYERRSKQYAAEKIPSANIVSLTAQIKSFVAMFLDEPHTHIHYYGGLLETYEGKIFATDHRPEPYYASGVALIAVERWLNSRPGDRFRPYKYHLLMILRAQIGGVACPRLNSPKISSYSLDIVATLRDEARCARECMRAYSLLTDALLEFGRPRGERNPAHRLRAFTLYLRRFIHSGHSPQSSTSDHDEITLTTADNRLASAVDGERSDGTHEFGRIVWFDDLRGYGFISRSEHENVFVHRSELGRVPWHLRVANTDVKYQVVQSPRSHDRIMASKVELDE